MSIQTFSFRAECLSDVEALYSLFGSVGVTSELETNTDGGFPDVYVQLRADASLDQLRELMRQVVDGHVMVQTLRPVPLAENCLERDFDLPI